MPAALRLIADEASVVSVNYSVVNVRSRFPLNLRVRWLLRL